VLDGRTEYKGFEYSATGEIGTKFSSTSPGMFLDAEQMNAQNTALIGKGPTTRRSQTAQLFVDYARLRARAGLQRGRYYIGKRFINNLEQGSIPPTRSTRRRPLHGPQSVGSQTTFQVYSRTSPTSATGAGRGGGILAVGLPRTLKFSMKGTSSARTRAAAAGVVRRACSSTPLHRIALAIPTLFIVAVIVFVLMRAIPGDPAQLMLGDLENPQALAQLRRDMGLDKPVAVQFAIWLKRLAVGDLGSSIAQQRPVLEMLCRGFGVTASLVCPRS
jgi:hypothetical protein